MCVEHGMHCAACTRLKKIEKSKATAMERFGADNAMKCPEVRAKQEAVVMEKYGVDNAAKCVTIKEKIKSAVKEIYGVEHIMQLSEYRARASETCMERYGVANPAQAPEIKERTVATNLERYGVEHAMMIPETRVKAMAAVQERFGVDNVSQVPEVQERMKATCLKRYGTEHPAQNPDVFEKGRIASAKKKEYTCPGGTVWMVQGYEPTALDELLATYSEDDLKMGKAIVFPHNGKSFLTYTTEDGATHNYFPDIFIPRENRIIEVKSYWTYRLQGGNVILKARAAIAAGYGYEIWKYDRHGTHKIVETSWMIE